MSYIYACGREYVTDPLQPDNDILFKINAENGAIVDSYRTHRHTDGNMGDARYHAVKTVNGVPYVLHKYSGGFFGADAPTGYPVDNIAGPGGTTNNGWELLKFSSTSLASPTIVPLQAGHYRFGGIPMKDIQGGKYHGWYASGHENQQYGWADISLSAGGAGHGDINGYGYPSVVSHTYAYNQETFQTANPLLPHFNPWADWTFAALVEKWAGGGSVNFLTAQNSTYPSSVFPGNVINFGTLYNGNTVVYIGYAGQVWGAITGWAGFLTNTVVHLALVYQSGTPKLYINGSVVPWADIGTVGTQLTPDQMWFGGSNAGTGMTMQEVFFQQSALADWQIATLSSNRTVVNTYRNTVYPPYPLAYYPLDEQIPAQSTHLWDFVDERYAVDEMDSIFGNLFIYQMEYNGDDSAGENQPAIVGYTTGGKRAQVFTEGPARSRDRTLTDGRALQYFRIGPDGTQYIKDTDIYYVDRIRKGKIGGPWTTDVYTIGSGAFNNEQMDVFAIDRKTGNLILGMWGWNNVHTLSIFLREIDPNGNVLQDREISQTGFTPFLDNCYIQAIDAYDGIAYVSAYFTNSDYSAELANGIWFVNMATGDGATDPTVLLPIDTLDPPNQYYGVVAAYDVCFDFTVTRASKTPRGQASTSDVGTHIVGGEKDPVSVKTSVSVTATPHTGVYSN